MKRIGLIISAAVLISAPALFACNPENDPDETGAFEEERPAVSSPSDSDMYQREARNAPADPAPADPATGQPATTDPNLASYEQRLDEVREDMRQLEQQGEAEVTSEVEERINEVEQALNEVRQQPGAASQERLDEVEQKLARLQ